MYLFIWIKQLLQAEMSTTRKRKDTCMIIVDRSRATQLNAQFCKIFEFIELKKFARFSRMKQWIEIEQKTIVRQLILVLTSLLINKWFYVIDFFRVLIDFILLAQYHFHNNSTLKYINHVLRQMNVYKEIFRHLRSQHKNISNEHFSFSKFHVMSHYIDFIRLYEITDEYDISHDEVKHKYMFKDFYEKINKKEIFWSNFYDMIKDVLTC